jgi:hypothetical protein
MKRIPRAGVLVLSGLILAASGGCYRSPDITWHAAHIYKGSQDPLLAKIQDRGLQQKLEQRFLAVQTDR